VQVACLQFALRLQGTGRVGKITSDIPGSDDFGDGPSTQFVEAMTPVNTFEN